jgi:hypothetical protein
MASLAEMRVVATNEPEPETGDRPDELRLLEALLFAAAEPL